MITVFIPQSNMDEMEGALGGVPEFYEKLRDVREENLRHSQVRSDWVTQSILTSDWLTHQMLTSDWLTQ